jgi:hypothetical protein
MGGRPAGLGRKARAPPAASRVEARAAAGEAELTAVLAGPVALAATMVEAQAAAGLALPSVQVVRAALASAS